MSVISKNIIIHNSVPQEFARGINIPLVKDKAADLCSVMEYSNTSDL